MDLDSFFVELYNIDNDKLPDFCRKVILHGTPFVFKDNEDEFYEFRKRIANKFFVYFNEVLITGSAKLGFSPFKGTEFSLDSDVDVSIVSMVLYEKMMDDILKFQIELRDHRRTVTEREIKMYHKFLEYTALGWIRPDQLPVSFNLSILKNDWFDYFNSISYEKSEVGNYKVSAGVFKSYRHLEEYTLIGLKQIKNSNKIKNVESI